MLESAMSDWKKKGKLSVKNALLAKSVQSAKLSAVRKTCSNLELKNVIVAGIFIVPVSVLAQEKKINLIRNSATVGIDLRVFFAFFSTSTKCFFFFLLWLLLLFLLWVVNCWCFCRCLPPFFCIFFISWSSSCDALHPNLQFISFRIINVEYFMQLKKKKKHHNAMSYPLKNYDRNEKKKRFVRFSKNFDSYETFFSSNRIGKMTRTFSKNREKLRKGWGSKKWERA